MYISFKDTLKLINEDYKVDSVKDAASKSNKFTIKPQGILMQDSFNNPFFPIQPRPRIDTSKLDLTEVFQRFRELYSQQKSLFLPFHFCVELVQDRYYVFNTRPLDMKFPITSNFAKSQITSDKWDEVTKMFFKENIFDISEAIHVCVIGCSNTDVYTQRIYEIIGRTCILPIVRQHRLPGALYQRVFPLNMGKRFNFDLLSKFIRN